MELQDGRSYLDRQYHVVTVKRITEPTNEYVFNGDNGWTYNTSGKCPSIFGNMMDHLHLMIEHDNSSFIDVNVKRITRDLLSDNFASLSLNIFLYPTITLEQYKKYIISNIDKLGVDFLEKFQIKFIQHHLKKAGLSEMVNANFTIKIRVT